MENRFLFRVINKASFMPAVSKGSGNANRANSVQPVSVLDNLAFKRAHISFHARALKRGGGYNFTNVVYDIERDRIAPKNLSRYFRSDSSVTAVKFPISYIVKQGRELHHKHISPLAFADTLSYVPNSDYVPPVVSRPFAFKLFPHHVGNPLNDFPIF